MAKHQKMADSSNELLLYMGQDSGIHSGTIHTTITGTDLSCESTRVEPSYLSGKKNKHTAILYMIRRKGMSRVVFMTFLFQVPTIWNRMAKPRWSMGKSLFLLQFQQQIVGISPLFVHPMHPIAPSIVTFQSGRLGASFWILRTIFPPLNQFKRWHFVIGSIEGLCGQTGFRFRDDSMTDSWVQ